MSAKIINNFPKVSRPGEYVAFFNIVVPTKEGPAFVYMACDAYSEFGFNTGAELDESPETVLKHVYLLTEDQEFVRHMDKGFTLVLDRFEELSERINAIIKPVNGKLLFDVRFHKQIAEPILKSFSKFVSKSKR